MARDITQMCNEAIGDLPAHPIVDIDDPNEQEARECARYLPGVVSELIALHDWDFVRRRVAMAEVTNDRPNEWAHAYALPGNLVSPIELVASATVTGLITPIWHWQWSYDRVLLDYVVADGKLYANIAKAVLEFSIDAFETSKWTPLFEQAVISGLAARIYRPILGEKADSREVDVKKRNALMAKNEAVADDLNRNPRKRERHITDAEMVRGAVGFGRS